MIDAGFPQSSGGNARLVQLQAAEPVHPGDADGRRAAQPRGAVHVDAPAAGQRALHRLHDARQGTPQAVPVKVHDLRGQGARTQRLSMPLGCAVMRNSRPLPVANPRFRGCSRCLVAQPSILRPTGYSALFSTVMFRLPQPSNLIPGVVYQRDAQAPPCSAGEVSPVAAMLALAQWRSLIQQPHLQTSGMCNPGRWGLSRRAEWNGSLRMSKGGGSTPVYGPGTCPIPVRAGNMPQSQRPRTQSPCPPVASLGTCHLRALYFFGCVLFITVHEPAVTGSIDVAPRQHPAFSWTWLLGNGHSCSGS